MGFTSLQFVFFVPIVFGLYWTIPVRWRNLLLLAASYYFYMTWNYRFGALLFATTFIDWMLGMQIEKSVSPKKKKLFVALSLISNLGCLAAFKYTAFLYNTFEWTRSEISGMNPHYMEALIIPVGLSFYVFHSLSYIIDISRGKIKAETNFGTFALFVSFFPQLVAGPIARFGELGVQFREEKKWNTEQFLSGCRLVLWGYFKKIVIADRLATIVNPVFENPETYNGLTLFIAGIFFTVQVYCDFSGYSDIAAGVARFFGYELKLNWRRPLLSKSLHEFWGRNHISMTSWFRDYLYISLGGSRVAYPRWLLNLFLVFLISGLWHGASWTFVVWGALHGIVYIVEIVLKDKLRIPFGGWIYLFLFHSLALIAFRAQSFTDLTTIYHHIFSFHWSAEVSYTELTAIADRLPVVLSFVGIACLFAYELREEHRWLSTIPKMKTVWRPLFYTLLFVSLFTIGEFSANEFIYFHF
ncbi:MAG: MBOAT family protein [Bacteroidia bacterium]|nr:MBOAT family protein [Bacteroidia bacterium]